MSRPTLTPLGLRLLSLSSAAPRQPDDYALRVPEVSGRGLTAALRALAAGGLLTAHPDGYALSREGEWTLTCHWAGWPT